MKRKLTIALVLALTAFAATWMLFHREPPHRGSFDRTQNALPVETKKVLDSGERFVLFSLDPLRQAPRPESGTSKGTFHDYVVLGKTEIKDTKEREKLLSALYDGIEDSDGLVASCFNPRHGISATQAGETVDLVICFECLSIKTYAKNGKGVLTTSSPQRTFNKSLKKAGLPMAKD